MKALIFNSGLGSRLGKLTAKNPKAMVRLGNGETVFGRQLRILYSCGIRDFVITTGPHSDQLLGEAAPYVGKGCTFSFVPNQVYDQTNYIYSMYRAKEQLSQGDFLVLHGDLVFDAAYAQKVIDSNFPTLGSVNWSLDLPEKDFKARIIDNEVREVSVKIFDDGCVAFQPFYKLSHEAMNIWLDNVVRFCEAGDVRVYAENAANEVFDQMHVAAFSYDEHLVEEIDTPDDLARVSAAIRSLDFNQQPVFSAVDGRLALSGGCAVGDMRHAVSVADILDSLEVKHPLVVAAGSKSNEAIETLLGSGRAFTRFSTFSEEPAYEEVVVGVRTYQVYGCDGIVSIGGNSAIDVAKCIKIFAAMPKGAEDRYAEGGYAYSPIKHLCLAGGDEASARSHVGACFVEGSEVKVEHDCLQPTVLVNGLI